MIPFTSARRLGHRADVELARPRSGRADARPAARARPRPAGAPSSSRAPPPSAGRSPARSGSGSSPFAPAVTAPSERISTWIAFSAAPPYMPGVEVALARRHLDVEGDEPARREAEHRHVDAEHSAVEDDRRRRRRARRREIQSTIVVPPISSSPSHAKRRLTGSAFCSTSRCAGLEQDVELALVVGDAARVAPTRP